MAKRKSGGATPSIVTNYAGAFLALGVGIGGACFFFYMAHQTFMDTQGQKPHDPSVMLMLFGSAALVMTGMVLWVAFTTPLYISISKQEIVFVCLLRRYTYTIKLYTFGLKFSRNSRSPLLRIFLYKKDAPYLFSENSFCVDMDLHSTLRNTLKGYGASYKYL